MEGDTSLYPYYFLSLGHIPGKVHPPKVLRDGHMTVNLHILAVTEPVGFQRRNNYGSITADRLG